ncbi:pili retraction protein PilT [Liquorilactobacillus sucicola DSM 21376 = JCM 15457]|uniref:PilT family ATPase n=1 Tax=Liquorilactobacillus sucicola DSM 21376 = JCM 15457 TaxID=1423806 RepID=A0A023CW72_9LACO|nr:PIN/TRAM domain-containing protein [Liquorilactobacillus sucicola]KRN05919.1 PilT family ATPase [Liquorilactobacillus sucicola DSM 21376 = JCM 15457]GAJ25826.1 pili retraction protein PilT [Liquorilactobacillus sucicola DSM 21376 = JCM 15457]
MRRKMIRLVLTILGVGAGYSFMPFLWLIIGIEGNIWVNNFVTNIVIGVLVMFLVSLFITDPLEKFIQRMENRLVHQSPDIIISTSVSVIVGLIIAVLISTLFSHSQLFILNTIIPIVLMVILGYLGFIVGRNHLVDFKKFLFARRKTEKQQASSNSNVLDRKAGDNFHRAKLLDTNILIDGRIYDLVKTGFIEGTLIVPNFVLYELQYIADSADSIKRVRGRRGLDILNKLREEKKVPVEMYEGDFEDVQEVDSKLIKLAKLLDAVIVTNDYNLNKVSEFQNVQVLNVNALAKALKPRVVPGERMNVTVIKNGTERQQGVAYLDDGTMIVVEDGRYYINKPLEVIVTSALQTDAGRMIFAKPAHSGRELREKN